MPQFFIERPIFAWVVALAIILAGLLAIPNMPISQYPEVAPPAITIQATYPGASAEDVAQSVSAIIENELNGATGLLYYESVSDSYGGSQITATFAPGTNPDLAQVDVQNRISNITAKLPGAVTEQGLKVSKSNANFLMVAALSSTDGSLDQVALADYITRNIQNSISRVPGGRKIPAVCGTACDAYLGRSRQADRLQNKHGGGQRRRCKTECIDFRGHYRIASQPG